MAVEAELGKRVGAVAARLHTARSRNDQVALDLRLHVRDRGAALLRATARARRHRSPSARRAREGRRSCPRTRTASARSPSAPRSSSARGAIGLARAADTRRLRARPRSRCPLGSGACSGTSLPIDRALVARLFAPWRADAKRAAHGGRPRLRPRLDVGRRARRPRARAHRGRRGRLLDERVRAGEARRRHRRGLEHDAAEEEPRRLRARARQERARAIGNVVAMLALMKGLASGYNRDQQEDRLPAPRGRRRSRSAASRSSRWRCRTCTFDARARRARRSTRASRRRRTWPRRSCAAASRSARRTRPWGALVALAVEQGDRAARGRRRDDAQAIHPALDAQALAALDPARRGGRQGERGRHRAARGRRRRSRGCAARRPRCARRGGRTRLARRASRSASSPSPWSSP